MDLVALLIKNLVLRQTAIFFTENNIKDIIELKFYPDVKVSIYSMLIDNSNKLFIFCLGQKLNSLDTNRW